MRGALEIVAGGLVVVLLIIVAANMDAINAAVDRFLVGLGIWLAVMAWLVLILLALAGVGALAMIWRRQSDRHSRQRDGSFALRRFRLPGGGEIILNPNNMAGPAIAYHPGVGVVELDPAAGWDRQVVVRQAVERTHHLQALSPGDDAISSRNGAMFRPGRAALNAPAARLLAGNYDKAKPIASVSTSQPTPQAQILPPVGVGQGLARSTPARWIVGQRADDGRLAAFVPGQHAHVGIVGATGTGKTSGVGFALAVQAIRHGYHLIILDPDGGADWRAFRTWAEWHETDRGTFPDQIRALHGVYGRRQDDSAARPIFVIVEEYGDLIHQLRMSGERSTAAHVDAMLDAILRRGRKRRIHLCLIDQYPEYWSQQVVVGTKFRAVFQLGPNQGSKMEEYKASQLPDRGAFLIRGERCRSWDVAAELPRLLTGPQVTPPRLLDGGVHGPGEGGLPPANGLMNGITNASREQAASNEQAAREYVRDHLDDGISDLARYLADSHGRPDEWQNFKSEASRWWHLFNPAGNNYQPKNLVADIDWSDVNV